MKPAWLVKKYVEDDDFQFLLKKPEEWQYEVIVPIVYAVLDEENNKPIG